MGKKSLYNIAILSLVSLLLALINYFWIKHNLSHLPPPWDQAAYMYMSLNEHEMLRHGNIIQFIELVLKQAPHIAPLFPVTVIPFFMFLGPSVQTAYLANSFYLFILLVSVFFMAERIADRKSAFVAVFLVATFPAVIAYSRDFLFEFPLAALTSLSYLFFLKSDSFEERTSSVLFGVCAGFAVLTKTMGMVFFVMPFLYGTYVFVRGPGRIRKNVCYALLSTFIVASVYYIPNLKYIFGYLFHFGVGAGSHSFDQGVSSVFSLKYWTVYIEEISLRGISIYHLLVFIAAATAFLCTREKKVSRGYWMLWLWFICGYILLSIPHNKGAEQYALPILPPLALITAVHISSISLKTVKYTMLAAAIVTGLTNYIYQTRSERCLYDSYFFKGRPALCPEHSTCRMQEAVRVEGDRNWNLETVLDYMDKVNTDRSKAIRILLAANHHFLNINNLKLYAFLGKINRRLLSDFSFEWIEDKSQTEVEQLANESHFIITKTGFQGPAFANTKNSLVRNLLNARVPMKSFEMSDGSIVFVYSGILKSTTR
ncbi:MAG TPA: glycosyltransferase family 39 protein [Thermodesulfovibrionales bacterium]|nr:glycosyltransferase family 39 protein [Thermodesulfovibrionales bacterium]